MNEWRKNQGLGNRAESGFGGVLFVRLIPWIHSVTNRGERIMDKGIPVQLESWDPEYYHLSGPPPVHAEVEFGEPKPKLTSATCSSC